MIENRDGGYVFLPGIPAYSSGVASMPGYEIEHVVLEQQVPWRDGLEVLRQFLADKRTSVNALCGVELRIPRQFTVREFECFNATYATDLKDCGVFVDGRNPVARTAVAPLARMPGVPSLYAFSWSRRTVGGGRTFAISGAGDIEEGPFAEAAIVCREGLTQHAMTEKALHVLRALASRLRALSLSPGHPLDVAIYTEVFFPGLAQAISEYLPGCIKRGVRWLPSLPPIVDLAFEMDCRCFRHESWI
jgi:hypothetical protein